MKRHMFSGFALLTFVCLSISHEANAQTEDRAALRARIGSLRAQIVEAERTYLAPAAEDAAAFEAFLQLPRTGLARLMPRETDDKALLTRGGGAYYSFSKRTNEYGFGSDLGLGQDMLQVGFAGADFGFLTVLGDVPIEWVKSAQPGVRFLSEFAAPTSEPEARQQQEGAGRGFELDGFQYKRLVPATVNTTYALRSITYNVSDVLAVFRVTRRDSDGSLILAWRILKQFEVPRLATP